MSIKIKLPKSASIDTVDVGIIDPIHEIPALKDGGVERIDLSMFDEWGELSVDKQRYLVEFSKQNMKKKRAALSAKVSINQLNHWLSSDIEFRSMYDSIIDLHTEAVEEMDYKAAFDPDNNTSRGRFLSKRSKVYKEEKDNKPAPSNIKNQTNIMAVLSSQDVQGKGLAGVQQMFNQLKEQGKIPSKEEVPQS